MENKADRVVSVRVPISVVEFLGAFSANNQITVGVFVKTADNVKKRCLSASALTEDGYPVFIRFNPPTMGELDILYQIMP